MNTTKTLRTLLVLTGLLFTASAQASQIAYSFTGGSVTSGQHFTYGFKFTANTNAVVDSLGFFDDGADGLASSHRAGIWTTGGTLLTSTTITNANSTLAGDVINGGQFRFTEIAGLALSAGTEYVFGVAIEGSSDRWYFGGTNLSPAAVDITAAATGEFRFGDFVFPDRNAGNRYHAGSFTIASAPVPAPLGGVVLLAVGLLALRRSARSAG